MPIPQTHHGLCVADIDAARGALAGVGFTDVQPNAPQPLRYADEPGDEVGGLTCPDLGSPYRTHYVEHPGTNHQIDLIEIDPAAIEPRPADAALCGDLTVVMPLPDTDLDAARTALAPFFGDRLEVTSQGDPWANHLRLLHRDLAAIDVAVAGRWILPPDHGFAFIAGPGGLTIELFDAEVTA